MAQDSVSPSGGQIDELTIRDETAAPSLPLMIRQVLKPLASLKLTVALFAASIFLVFAGTLAQTRIDVWHVMDLYFRTWFAYVEFRTFFPPAWVESTVQKDWRSFFLDFKGGFYFPGGFLIGLLMGANLLAAHLVRFTIQAKGSRLWLGLGVIGLGCLATYGVIVGGSNADGIQGVPVFSWTQLWWMVKIGLAASSVAGAFMVNHMGADRKVEQRLLTVASSLLFLLGIWLLWEGERINLGDSSMRILWQLIQATLAGIVLLIGCIMVFKKRGGVVLLHAGIGLMMISELMVATSAKESQMFIREGSSSNLSIDARNPELAFIDTSDPEKDHVVTVPDERLTVGTTLSHPDLPCDIKVLEYFKNARPRMLKTGEENKATVGRGLREGLKPLAVATGVSNSDGHDRPGAYIELLKKNSGESLGTLMLVTRDIENGETVTIDGKPFQILLRFEHLYRDYKFKLTNFIVEYYPGTTIPKNYESDVEITDPTVEGVRKTRIWMNNPLRYRGLTYYQSGVGPTDSQGRESTILQVVSNHGWMIPYVSCMIVAVGMFYHFGLVLIRFLKRGSWKIQLNQVEYNPSNWIVPGIMVLVCMAYIGNYPKTKKSAEGFDLEAFGKLPIVDQGRVKPIDTYARLAFRVVSTLEEVDIYPGDGNESSKTTKLTAIRWFLDVISGSEAGMNAPVVRIDHPDVLNTLGLDRKKGLRYSLRQLEPKFKEIIQEEEKVDALKSSEQTPYDRKIKELTKRLGEFRTLKLAFDLPIPIPTPKEMEKSRDEAISRLSEVISAIQAFPDMLIKLQAPSVIPTLGEKDVVTSEYAQWSEWQPLSIQVLVHKLKLLRSKEAPINPITEQWEKLLTAYRQSDADGFNRAVSQIRRQLRDEPPANLNFAATDFENFFNHVSPFYSASVLYLIALIMALASWLGGPMGRTLNRTSFAVIAFTLLLHSWAIWARMSISGRPPVTNLYTTAIFIGWATVLFGLAFEGLFKIGIGNVLAASTGWATLLISHGIAGDGDTFTVLQAVLDTQFWLATHVVTINLGYATTFVSGMLGVLYVLLGLCTPKLTPEVSKSITRMIYGTLCFGTFFSFVGTVLGGLWGDDSWGRFWGWDPKENGALIIVLWNVLVLHARWDGMVKDRGLAVLSIGGNIWTAWSWFGVNQLGVGLHSYGSTEGTLQKLILFALSQMVIIALGSLPKSWWYSFRSQHQNPGQLDGNRQS